MLLKIHQISGKYKAVTPESWIFISTAQLSFERNWTGGIWRRGESLCNKVPLNSKGKKITKQSTECSDHPNTGCAGEIVISPSEKQISKFYLFLSRNFLIWKIKISLASANMQIFLFMVFFSNMFVCPQKF